jgi:hypothetical protein
VNRARGLDPVRAIHRQREPDRAGQLHGQISVVAGVNTRYVSVIVPESIGHPERSAAGAESKDRHRSARSRRSLDKLGMTTG